MRGGTACEACVRAQRTLRISRARASSPFSRHVSAKLSMLLITSVILLRALAARRAESITSTFSCCISSSCIRTASSSMPAVGVLWARAGGDGAPAAAPEAAQVWQHCAASVASTKLLQQLSSAPRALQAVRRPGAWRTARGRAASAGRASGAARMFALRTRIGAVSRAIGRPEDDMRFHRSLQK